MSTNFEDFSLSGRAAIGLAGQMSLAEQKQAFLAAVINQALAAYQGNQCHAATALHIHRNTLARIVDTLRAAGLLTASLKKSDYRKPVQSAVGQSAGRKLG